MHIIHEKIRYIREGEVQIMIFIKVVVCLRKDMKTMLTLQGRVFGFWKQPLYKDTKALSIQQKDVYHLCQCSHIRYDLAC